MTKEKSEWFINYKVYYEGDPNTVNNLRKRLADMMNKLQMKDGDAIWHIFITGLKELENKPELRSKLDPSLQGMAATLQEKAVDDQVEKILEYLYNKYGPEDFIRVCEERHLDYQSFLEKHTWRASDLQWNKRARSWLHEYMSDGTDHATATVRKDAISANLISSDDSDWAKLRALANRMGFTQDTDYGHWKLNE
jgi:hypothetical protein